MASTYLTRTLGTPTDENRWTYSFWTKISKTGDYSWFLQTGTNASNNVDAIHTNDANSTIRAYGYPGSQVWELITNAKYRDPSAWYHIVIAYNSDEATSSDRAKMWVNGVQQTSFSTEIYPSLGANSGHINKSGSVYYIGSNIDTNDFSEMLMTHLHFIDGTAYDASAFGEYDAQNVWKPKTQPSVTYGTNGFFLKFANSGSLGTDSSGNDNDFTVNGTGTQTLDTPSNVFTTWNPLENYYQSATLSNGNTTIQTGNSQYSPSSSTLGVSSGKWYWEVEYDALSGGSDVAYVGVLSQFATNSTTSLGTNANDYGYYVNGNYYNNNTGTAYGATYTTGDIIGVALDLDNNKLYFSKNGTFQNSGDPTSGATGTGAISITDPASTTNGAYFPSICDGSSSANATFKTNFGNGYYGTTAVSTPNADGDGYGKFEYSVPTGYYALCTKNIQTYG
jgi:hypothetical protein